jgi:hypothetical protein
MINGAPNAALHLRCRCCGNETAPLFTGRLLGQDVQYFECRGCAYVQTEQPYWLERAYERAINDSDTGILARNFVNARIVLATLPLIGGLQQRVVDYAGGYGLLVRRLRDYGVDALWADPYCDNLIARGFEYPGGPAGLVTAFEAFEHFVEPRAELERMLAIAPNVLLSTLLIPAPAPQHDRWWYYGREHGQHVGLFRLSTLRTLATRYGKSLVSDGHSYHLLADQPVSARRWKLTVRANRVFAGMAARRLASRTWSDHQLLAGQPGGDA